METLLRKLGLVLLVSTLTFTACKKNSIHSSNNKRVRHQQALKNKYDEPTDKLAKGSKLKGEY